MNFFKLSFMKTLILIFCMAWFVPLDASLGDPVPGAEVYIEQEPNCDPVVSAEAGSDGKFDCQNSLKGFEKNKSYSVKVRIPVMKLDRMKHKFEKMKKMVIHLQIGQFKNSSKRILFEKKFIIDSTQVLRANGKKIKVGSFSLKENIEILIPTKAAGSRSGFAIGGFSLT